MKRSCIPAVPHSEAKGEPVRTLALRIGIAFHVIWVLFDPYTRISASRPMCLSCRFTISLKTSKRP